MRFSWIAVVLALALPAGLQARELVVAVDATAATAVLAAVNNPRLTLAEAMAVARLPGNQGLIRKSISYGRTASDASFAQALMAAAHRDAAFIDTSRFELGRVRDNAQVTAKAMTTLLDPGAQRIDQVKARIAAFTPAGLDGRVTGYLVVGGTSGGFAFGEPEFFLNLDQYPSPELAATIMSHELFHAVQALAQSAARPNPATEKCVAAAGGAAARGADVAGFFGSLLAEGTASFVGDILALPKTGLDAPSARERSRFARNVDLVGRSITQLELSVHGLTTGAGVTADEVYELGFYNDEVMYGLGYVMAAAIAGERGNAAIADLIGQSGATFVQRYVRLQSYGTSEAVPALKPATVRWAETLAACAPAAR